MWPILYMFTKFKKNNLTMFEVSNENKRFLKRSQTEKHVNLNKSV